MFFLATAMLVTIIGLSALTVVRVKRRAAEAVNNAAAAQEYAQSAVEQGLLAIYATAGWRSSIAHDTWAATRTIGAGSITWKLVDEINGSLTLDHNARVRVYGKGVCGPSTWVYSVLVQPPLEALPSELLTNGNLETGAVSPWWDTGCTLKLDTSNTHGGANSLLIWLRTSVTASACQTIAAKIQAGTVSHVRAWVRARTWPETVNVGVWVRSGAGWVYYPIGTLAATTSWQAAEGAFTPTWSGALLDAYLEIAGTSRIQELLIDDVSLTAVPGPVGMISGTWRREAQ